jgi:predicted transcriptional regulator
MAVERFPDLSKTEWSVMNICWKSGKSTARQIYNQTKKKKKWEYQTVKTMLDRLANKGYLRKENLGPLCLYEANVRRSRVVARAIDAFVGNILDNAIAPLFVHLARSKKLKEDEITALRQILEKQEEEKGSERNH